MAHEMFTQCWIHAGPSWPSMNPTLGKHLVSVGLNDVRQAKRKQHATQCWIIVGHCLRRWPTIIQHLVNVLCLSDSNLGYTTRWSVAAYYYLTIVHQSSDAGIVWWIQTAVQSQKAVACHS